jgi:GAF domain-containing protein
VVDFTLAARMRDVAASLSEPADLEEVMTRVTHTARETVPGADYCSVSIRHVDGTLKTMGETDALVLELDRLQYELREGPCYEVITHGETRSSPDIGTDPRWLTFGPEARRLGIGSQLAVRMPGSHRDVTGLNLYSRKPHAFDHNDGIAELFACQAGIALGYAREVGSLRRALRTRADIGAAVGLVMARYRLSQERAFEFLVRLSSTSNVKLREVASQVVEAGGAPAHVDR